MSNNMNNLAQHMSRLRLNNENSHSSNDSGKNLNELIQLMSRLPPVSNENQSPSLNDSGKNMDELTQRMSRLRISNENHSPSSRFLSGSSNELTLNNILPRDLDHIDNYLTQQLIDAFLSNDSNNENNRTRRINSNDNENNKIRRNNENNKTRRNNENNKTRRNNENNKTRRNNVNNRTRRNNSNDSISKNNKGRNARYTNTNISNQNTVYNNSNELEFHNDGDDIATIYASTNVSPIHTVAVTTNGVMSDNASSDIANFVSARSNGNNASTNLENFVSVRSNNNIVRSNNARSNNNALAISNNVRSNNNALAISNNALAISNNVRSNNNIAHSNNNALATSNNESVATSNNENESDQEMTQILLDTLTNPENQDLEYEYNQMALEAQVPLVDDEYYNILLRNAGILLDGLRRNADNANDYISEFLVATVNYMRGRIESINEAVRPMVIAQLETIQGTLGRTGSNLMSAIEIAIRLLLTHLELLTPSRETMINIVIIIYGIGRRIGLSLGDAVQYAARCIARAGRVAADGVIRGLRTIGPLTARIGAGALDLGFRMIRSGSRWVWSNLATYTPIVLHTLDESQRNTRAFLSNQLLHFANELSDRVRSSIQTATPVVVAQLRRLLKGIKTLLVLLRRAISTGSVSLGRISLIYLQILARNFSNLTGYAITTMSNVFLLGGRIITNGLINIGGRILRQFESREVAPSSVINRSIGVLQQATYVNVPAPVPGSQGPAAGPGPGPRVRQRNAPLVRTLIEARQPVPYGLRKGELFTKGVMGGKRRTIKRRKTRIVRKN